MKEMYLNLDDMSRERCGVQFRKHNAGARLLVLVILAIAMVEIAIVKLSERGLDRESEK